MSFGSWRLVGVKWLQMILFLITMELPSVRGRAGTMLRRYRCNLPATSVRYSSSIYHGPLSSVWELGWCSGYNRRSVSASKIRRHGEMHQHLGSVLAFRLAFLTFNNFLLRKSQY